MSFHNKWPTDGRMDYMPGWISKSGGTAGQLHFPATEDPRDYSIYLVHAPGGGGGGVGFTLTNRSWITIGSGINSFGHEIGVKMAGASNIRFDRGTHINQRFHWDFSGTACSNITVNRVRTSHGCIKHQPLVNWKFGGPLESSYRGGTFAFDGHDNQNLANNVTMQDCTFHGWHDFQLGGGTNWVIKQCTFIQVMDDGWQLYPTVAQGMVVHHCYFLDSPLGGLENDAGSNTLNTQAIYFSHNIFDHRCPRIVDTGTSPQSEPYLAAFNAPHYNAGVRCPYKWYNNTVIWSPDANGKKGPWLTHCEGDESATSPFHENFNNIVMVLDYQRYVGNAPSGGAWLGQCSSVCRRMITTGANEAHDYCILWRDVPNPETHFFQEIIPCCSPWPVGLKWQPGGL
jgi:hypothetical protein